MGDIATYQAINVPAYCSKGSFNVKLMLYLLKCLRDVFQMWPIINNCFRKTRAPLCVYPVYETSASYACVRK